MEMNPKPTHKWILVLRAFDDEQISVEVLKERIAFEEDEVIAAFLRGGELMMVLGYDHEQAAEAFRVELEKNCLRLR